MLARRAAVALLTARVAYGVALVLAPERLARSWLGASAAQASTQVPLRALGAREVLIHCGALAAARAHAPLRPWLAASIAGDLSDVAATFRGAAGLPAGSPRATLALAGGSALLTASLVGALER